MCGSPGEGKYIRSIASSARAGEHLMCSPCEQDCPSRRPNPAPRPGERLGTGDLQVADDQFHLAFEVDGADGAGRQQVASLVDGVAADGAFAVDD